MAESIASRAVAWRFLVTIAGSKPSLSAVDAEFVECSGLTVERETSPIAEGGRNDYTLSLPGRLKYTNITLKRGLINDKILAWLMEQAETTIKPVPATVTIRLANESGESLYTWTVSNAYPVKWTGPSLKADSNELAMEELELAHTGFKLESGQ